MSKTKRQKQLSNRLKTLKTIRSKWLIKNNLKDNQKWLKKYDYIFGQVEGELWNLTREVTKK